MKAMKSPEIITAIRFTGATPRAVEQYMAQCRESGAPVSMEPLYKKLATRWGITLENAEP